MLNMMKFTDCHAIIKSPSFYSIKIIANVVVSFTIKFSQYILYPELFSDTVGTFFRLHR
jgi:hypothetical protein